MRYLKSAVWVALLAGIVGTGTYYEFRAAEGLDFFGLFRGSDTHVEFVPLGLPPNGRYLKQDEQLVRLEDAAQAVNVNPVQFHKIAPQLTDVRSLPDPNMVRHAGELNGVIFFAMEDIRRTHDCGLIHGRKNTELRAGGVHIEYAEATRGDYITHAIVSLVALLIAGAILFVVCMIACGLLLFWWQPIEVKGRRIVFVS